MRPDVVDNHSEMYLCGKVYSFLQIWSRTAKELRLCQEVDLLCRNFLFMLN